MEHKFDRGEFSDSSVPDLNIDSVKAATAVRRAQAFEQFEYVDVTFNATEDTDTDIRHTLNPPTPDDIDWIPVRWSHDGAPAECPHAYRDISATRKAWGDGYIVLRCNLASAQATLLLTVRRT